MTTVSDDMRGYALGDGNKLARDDKKAVVGAGKLLLDDHAAADRHGALERLDHLRFVSETGRHTAALVAVERLDHDRPAASAASVRASRVPPR